MIPIIFYGKLNLKISHGIQHTMSAQMQLRNGKIVSNDTTPSYTPVMDGQDYMPHLAWSESSYKWLDGLQTHINENGFSTWQEVYDFMNYNANNAEVWCTQEPFVKGNEDTAWFLVSMYQWCEEFSKQARAMLDRPATRQQQQFLEENNGLLRGILRLGTEIRVHWALSQGHVTA